LLHLDLSYSGYIISTIVKHSLIVLFQNVKKMLKQNTP